MLDWSWLIKLSLLCVRCMYGVRISLSSACYSVRHVKRTNKIFICWRLVLFSSCRSPCPAVLTKSAKHVNYSFEIILSGSASSLCKSYELWRSLA